MRPPSTALFALSTALLAAACSGSQSPLGGCTAGATQSCACPDSVFDGRHTYWLAGQTTGTVYEFEK
jgi:ABC-type glycerol-3-phosphate transport system substrate-binding protein